MCERRPGVGGAASSLTLILLPFASNGLLRKRAFGRGVFSIDPWRVCELEPLDGV